MLAGIVRPCFLWRVATLLVLFLLPAAAFASFPIQIQPGSYVGRYYLSDGVNPQQGPFFGPTTPSLGPNITYSVDTGANVGGSSFSFTVSPAGDVINISNPGAASGSSNILTFKNATISIDPAAYSGRYFISSFGTNSTLTGLQTPVVVPGLRYGIDTGANVGGSSFNFDVDGSGQVSVPPASVASATASGATLRFNNASIRVDPLAYTGRYYLSSHSPNFFTGLQTVVEVPGLVYYVDDGSFVVGSNFHFTVNAAGQITNVIDPATNLPSTSATASGNVLTLLNVLVAVNPGTYTGPYRIGGYLSLSGPTSVVLIPSLSTNVIVPVDQTGYIVATLAQVVPSTITFTVNGQPDTFTFGSGLQGLLSLMAAQVASFLASGNIATGGIANSLTVTINHIASLISSNPAAAKTQLNVLLNKVNTFAGSGQISAAVSNTLVSEINFLLSSLP